MKNTSISILRRRIRVTKQPRVTKRNQSMNQTSNMRLRLSNNSRNMFSPKSITMERRMARRASISIMLKVSVSVSMRELMRLNRLLTRPSKNRKKSELSASKKSKRRRKSILKMAQRTRPS